MSGSKTNKLTLAEVKAAVQAFPPGKDYVWDGVDEDDRPATTEEMQAAIAADLERRVRGAQKSPTKERITIRLSPEVVQAFRDTGAGWQTRIDAALQDWLATHKAA